MHIPITLESALRAGMVIPFVGAGVSMAVLDRGTSQPLFPNWAELLRRAADRLDQERKAAYAAVVRNLLQLDTPEYLEAARRARQGLGPVWFTFLKEHLDHPRERADDASLRLAQALWALGSALLITTNYDRVLRWACPHQHDLDIWDIEAPAEQVDALRGDVRRPTIWHLHGQISNAAHLILTPDGYRRLYPDDRAVEGRYQAALATLRSLLTSKVFLFVGFSLEDDYVTHQLRSIEDLFQGTTGPHYVLVQESARDHVTRLQVPVEVLTFPGFGAPLVECLHALGKIAAHTSTPIEGPGRLSGPPGELPQPSVLDPRYPSSRTPGESGRGIGDTLHCPPADRDDELQFFDRLIAGRTSERIWLLEAETGMGKTTLLREFVRHCPPEIACVPIDLKGGISGLHEIFYRLCNALGWDHFPTVQARVENLGQAVVQTNTIISHADIAVALRTPDRGDRLTRRAELTRAFFDDLHPLKRRLLIIFDTFDDAAPDVQEWLQGSFLAFARRTSHLVVIVAGRRVPEDSIEWATCCIRHRLVAVCEPESWQRYADRRGAVFQSREWIAAFCDLLGGHPLQMAEAIARYIPRGG